MRTGWRRRLAVLVCVAAGAIGLAACDPGEDPTDGGSSSSETSSGTESSEPVTSESTEVATPPDVEPPEFPEGAEVNDHRGAILATQYFLDLYVYMGASGRTGEFEAMSGPECEFCTSSVETVEDIYEAGGWVEGGGLSFDLGEATAEYPTEDEPNYLVRFAGNEEPSVTHYGDGTTEARDGATFESVVALLFVNDRFIVSGVNSE